MANKAISALLILAAGFISLTTIVQAAIAAKPLADLEAIWGDGLFKGDRWIELVYHGAY